VGVGRSSQGHVSTTVKGATYSFGPNGMSSESAADYAARNEFRGSVISNIPLTPKQDGTLQDFLKNYNEDYNFLTKNCTAPAKDGLRSVGVDLGDSLLNNLPVGLGNSIIDSGAANGYTFTEGK